MGEVIIQDTTLTEIADAIRERNKTTAKINAKFMAQQIRSNPESSGFIDTSTITNWKSFFSGDNRYDLIHRIDTSNGVNFENFFGNSSRTKFHTEKLNTSKGINFAFFCDECRYLTEFDPPIDTSNGEDFSYFFNMCELLQNAPLLNTSKGKNFHYMYYNCKNLKDGGVIDMTNADNEDYDVASYMFGYCKKLEKLKIKVNGLLTSKMGRMFYLGEYSDTFTDFEIECTIDENGVKHGIKVDDNGFTMIYHTNLSVDSLLSILNALEDNTGEATTYSVFLGDNLNKLTAEQKQIAYKKNINLK